MAFPDSTFFLLAFSLVFPAYFYSALCRPKTVSLLTNGIHSIQRRIPHHSSLQVICSLSLHRGHFKSIILPQSLNVLYSFNIFKKITLKSHSLITWMLVWAVSPERDSSRSDSVQGPSLLFHSPECA